MSLLAQAASTGDAVALTPFVLAVAGVLFHQVSRLWEQGLSGVAYHYAPVLVVRLPRWATVVAQLVALPAALALALVPQSLTARAVAVALLVLWMVSTQRRLADHALLGVVAAALFAFVPWELHGAVARDLLIGVYLSAALLKINEEYLGSERSAGRVVTAHYLGLLGLKPSARLLRPAPYAVFALELAVGITLLVPGLEIWGLCAAILMHGAFGVSGNFPFSVLALALWVIALTARDSVAIDPGGGPLLWASVAGSALIALALGRTTSGRRSVSYLGKDLFQGLVYGYLCGLALSAQPFAALPTGTGALVTHLLVGGAFLLNVALVPAGLKLEWSFAMFSSLRPFGRSWLERRPLVDLPRYYSLTLPARIPKTLLREVEPRFIFLVTRDENVVHESVAFCLEESARKCRTSFAPRLMALAEDARELTPVGATGDEAPPRRRLLTYPAVVPKSLDRRYLA
ncbi:hypothetical protein ACIA74_35995 [Streptomyces sp. NPDC051658]|uniref:hypothetical protein n=1 Tax=Streptomyces sp. NPDC051658 TaxID=3365667 RepID=UPI0037B4C90C